MTVKAKMPKCPVLDQKLNIKIRQKRDKLLDLLDNVQILHDSKRKMK